MTDNWEEAYERAALEVDKLKMVERISAARQAIQLRLRVLGQSGEEEKKRMEIALKNLKSFETDCRTWS